MTSVAIIDYGSGNLRSAAKAFERAAGCVPRAPTIHVTGDPEELRSADFIVLPGVGAFGSCLSGLEAIDGMRDALEEHVRHRGKPFLGICVGMQLLAESGLEHGLTPGLGWIRGQVQALHPRPDPDGRPRKTPHMGWNRLLPQRDHPVLRGIGDGRHVYFVHSFHLVPDCRDDVLATTDHGEVVTAAVGRDTMVGTQFHPEKSQATGLRIIANFLAWRP